MALPKVSLVLCMLFLFSSTALAASTVLGIDLGTEYIKATLVKPGIPLEIVLTKDSRRKEAATVAFKPQTNSVDSAYPERLYGSDAVALAARFPADVYPNLKPLLGLLVDEDAVNSYAKYHPALKISGEKTRNSVALGSSSFSADDEPWMVEELLAMELQSIQKNAEALAGKGNSVRDVVITVPPFYTAEEKRAVEMAADLAGLRILSLVTDGLAVGLNYATSRTFPSISEGKKPEIHMVFDMGAGSTKASVLKFQGRSVKDVGKFNKTIQEVEVLGSAWDRSLGGDSLNSLIVDDMIAKFVDTKGFKALGVSASDVQRHGRTMNKLWKESERLRQVLSANSETSAGFEGLFQDVDFKYKLSRADLESKTEAYVERVAKVFQDALAAASISDAAEIDSVILHGGVLRTPFVQKALEKAAGGADKLRSNVNSDEAAVFGAGFMGASLSPSFRVKEIKAYEKAGYAAGLKWVKNNKTHHQRLFKATSQLGAEKVVTLKSLEDLEVQFFQTVGETEKDLMSLVTKNLTLSVAALKSKYGCEDADIDTKFGLRLNTANGLPEVTRGWVQCVVDEPEKKGVVDGVKGLFGFGSGSKKDEQEPLGADDAEADSSSTSTTSSKSTSTSSASASSTEVVSKKSEKIISLDLATAPLGLPTLSASDLFSKKQRLAAFEDSDRSRQLRDEAVNQLEGFTYKCRDLLEDETFTAAATAQEKELLESKSQSASEWLYDDGANAPRSELKARLKELKDIVNPVNTRREEASQRPDSIKAFQDALDQSKKMIETLKAQIEAMNEASSAPPTSTTESEAQDETSSSDTARATPIIPAYTTEDLTPLIGLFESSTEWFEKKVAEQDALSATDNPILLVKDLTSRAKALNEAVMELLMKSMRQQKKSSSKKPKSTKTKTSSATSSSAPSETPAADDAAEHKKDEL